MMNKIIYIMSVGWFLIVQTNGFSQDYYTGNTMVTGDVSSFNVSLFTSPSSISIGNKTIALNSFVQIRLSNVNNCIVDVPIVFNSSGSTATIEQAALYQAKIDSTSFGETVSSVISHNQLELFQDNGVQLSAFFAIDSTNGETLEVVFYLKGDTYNTHLRAFPVVLIEALENAFKQNLTWILPLSSSDVSYCVAEVRII